MNAEETINSIRTWASTRPDLQALALIGSHTRGEARPDSDLDVVLVVQEPSAYLTDHSWVSTFGSPARIATEDWGALTSLRVHYTDGLEIEFGLTTPAWCSLPVDPGTRRVTQAGCVPLLDPHGLLRNLQQACADPPPPQTAAH